MVGKTTLVGVFVIAGLVGVRVGRCVGYFVEVALGRGVKLEIGVNVGAMVMLGSGRKVGRVPGVGDDGFGKN